MIIARLLPFGLTLVMLLAQGTTPAEQQAAEQAKAALVVDIRTVLSQDSLERDDEARLSVIVSNQSDVPLRGLCVSVTGDHIAVTPVGCVVPTPSAAPSAVALPAFATTRLDFRIEPGSEAAFGDHTFLVSVEYSWSREGETFTSTQVVAVDLHIKRRFEDELGGFLGGAGAAILYFLLPVYPAIAAFQFGEQVRKRQPPRIPSLSAEQNIPMAILAVAAVLVAQYVLGRRGNDLLGRNAFFGTVLVSVGLGLVVPTGHAAYDWVREKRWGYTGNEDTNDYLHKALLGPYGKPEREWVKLKAYGEEWEGLLLDERRNRVVLGARLKVAPRGKAQSEDELRVLRKEIVADPKSFLRRVKEGSLLVDRRSAVLKEKKPVDRFVAILANTARGQPGVETDAGGKVRVVEVVD